MSTPDLQVEAAMPSGLGFPYSLLECRQHQMVPRVSPARIRAYLSQLATATTQDD
ncbi:hypothetical protein [Paraburkholderia dipogonis]|uniref:hypothetical protein n=1 Tax=Paraburkholderia dipogonis TaxID=1211383 RepID=UPI0038B6C936